MDQTAQHYVSVVSRQPCTTFWHYVSHLSLLFCLYCFPKICNVTDINKQSMTNKFSLQRSSAKTDENENVTTSVFECFTGLSPVEVSYYGIASTGVIVYHEPQNLTAGFNSTQICQLYGGSCAPAADCPTVHLYGQYRRSKVTCNSTTICCCLLYTSPSPRD